MYQPQLQAGVVETLYQPPTVADIIPSGQTNSPIVRYVTESTTVVNAAAGVAAGSAKPESTLDFVQVDEPVKKIATLLPVQDEMLEDAAQIQSYINNRLSLFIRLQEDVQILRGGGTNDLTGIVGRSGVNTLGTAAAGTIPAEHVFKAANGVRGSSYLNPDTLVINPTSWQTLRLAKDSSGQYLGGGPWYGQLRKPGSRIGQQVLHRRELLGPERCGDIGPRVGHRGRRGVPERERRFSGAQGSRWRRRTRTPPTSPSNMTAIRAEERLALAVYRPSAFCTITF